MNDSTVKGIFFTSEEHKERFLTAMQKLGKVDRGKFDLEYGAALYVLTADPWIWQDVEIYVSSRGIDFEGMLDEVDFSGGYSVLPHLASNLFNGNDPIMAVDIPTRLDEKNFRIAMSAFLVRRYSLRVSDFKVQEGE